MSLIARVIRSGVVEAEHHGAVAAVGAGGGLVAAYGDVDRRFFSRSSVKPFQAVISIEAGARFTDTELAVVCSSHGGLPAHLAFVRQILQKSGLDQSALQTPPAYPLSPRGRDMAVRGGARSPERIFHDCSGKHAGWLAACVAAGWPTDSYLDPKHPLQQRVAAIIGDVTSEDVGSPGVDGCGAPVFEVSTRGLATAFARLGSDDRFARAWTAMHRYPALASYNGRIDQRIATALNAVAKVGAEGCIGVSLPNGLGLAAKAWDGSFRGLGAGITGALGVLGLTVGVSGRYVEEDQVVLGGARPVGHVESMVNFS